jgi:hypothetical protein
VCKDGIYVHAPSVSKKGHNRKKKKRTKRKTKHMQWRDENQGLYTGCIPVSGYTDSGG